MNFSSILTRWRFIWFVAVIALSVNAAKTYPAAALQQSPGCPIVMDAEGVTSQERLYYMIFDIPRDTPPRVVQLWFVDEQGHHDTGLRVQFPSTTDAVRARISPSGYHMALLFFTGQGDPTKMSSQAVLALVDLLNGSTQSHSLNLQAQYYGSSFSYSSMLVTGYYHEYSDLLWGWLDDHTIVFNQPEAQYILDTETGVQSSQEWPANPWGSTTDAWRLAGANISYFGFYAKRSSTHTRFLKLDVIDLATGDIAISDLLVRYQGLSFDEEGARVLFESPQNELVLLDLPSGEQITAPISDPERSIFENAGYFVPSSDGLNVVLHTDTVSPMFSDQVYLVKMGLSSSEILPFCLTGETDYSVTRPSWSSDEHYVFTMSGFANQAILTEVYVYDAHNHVLERVIDNTQFENRLSSGQVVEIIGWGVNLAYLPVANAGTDLTVTASSGSTRSLLN